MTDAHVTGDKIAPDAVVIERSFPAPVELLWRLWTEPELFAAWYGPVGAKVVVAKMDVRVGGARLVGMEMDMPGGPTSGTPRGPGVAGARPGQLRTSRTVLLDSADQGWPAGGGGAGRPTGGGGVTPVRAASESSAAVRPPNPVAADAPSASSRAESGAAGSVGVGRGLRHPPAGLRNRPVPGPGMGSVESTTEVVAPGAGSTVFLASVVEARRLAARARS